MKKYLIAENLILRSPSGNKKAYTLNANQIRSDHLFMCALAIASPQFYSKVNGDTSMDDRMLLSLQRYYNRFCFRPTPFGLFSTITPMKWNTGAASDLDETPTIFLQLDNHLSHELYKMYGSARQQRYVPNPTLYRFHREFRFVRTETDYGDGKRQYLLQATDYSVLLKRLLKLCATGADHVQMAEVVSREARCSRNESLAYVTFLIDAQIFLPLQWPVITGDDRIKRLLSDQFGADATGLSSALKALLDNINKSTILDEKRLLSWQETAFKSLTKITAENKPLLNVISMKNGAQAAVDSCHRQMLQEGLFALQCLSPYAENPQLNDFAKKFNSRFEGQLVPLLHALDPEIGIGYGDAEQAHNLTLLETIAVQPHEDHSQKMAWTAIHQLLLDRWHNAKTGSKQNIVIREEDLDNLQALDDHEPSSGFGVLFRANASGIWLEAAGGYHTNSLIGRFTPASPTVLNAAKSMAEHDQQLNPELIFAELLHVSDLHTDNINRRSAILPLEMPITAAATADRSEQIALSDLYLFISGDKVLLMSKSHGKVVIPRLSSAYNFRQDKLPLFRLLADLPYQFQSNIRTLELESFFPGLRFYPRVIYKQTILCLAQWKLDTNDVKALSSADEQHVSRLFYKLKLRYGLTDVFALTRGDQQIIFDSRKLEELKFFVNCIRSQTSVKLQEVFIDQKTGEYVTQQFNAFVLASAALDLPPPPQPLKQFGHPKRKFMPGSEWLYIKIYTSRLATDHVLKQLIPYLKKQQRTRVIKKWFFVRYEDHAPHIRFRFLVDTENVGVVLKDLREMFDSKVEQQIIREYTVDTYTRELERYGVTAYETVETLFHASSELVLGFLTRPTTDHYLFALASARALLDTAFITLEEQQLYVHASYLQFKTEFTGNKTELQLDRKFRLLKPVIESVLDDELYFEKLRLHRHNSNHRKVLLSLLTDVADKGDSRQLVSSVIHMHLNRIFTTESRKQEMMVYYFLYKYLKSARYRPVKKKS